MDFRNAFASNGLLNAAGSVLTSGLFIIALGVAGCDETDGPAENVGEQIDKTVEQVGDKVEAMGDKVEEAADDLKKKAE